MSLILNVYITVDEKKKRFHEVEYQLRRFIVLYVWASTEKKKRESQNVAKTLRSQQLAKTTGVYDRGDIRCSFKLNNYKTKLEFESNATQYDPLI